MAIDFSQIKSLSIPEGDVKSISIGGVVVWQKAAAKTLTKITTRGQKTSYYTGETFSYTGTCTATYSDGTTAVVTPTASSPSMSSAGTKTVTLTYTENGVTATTTYSITVIARYWIQASSNGTSIIGYLRRNGDYVADDGTTSTRTALVIESGGFKNNNTSKVYFLAGTTKYYVTWALEGNTYKLKLTTTASSGKTWTILQGNTTHNIWQFWDDSQHLKWNVGSSAVTQMSCTGGKPSSTNNMGFKYTLIS